MKGTTYREVMLPDHEKATGMHICHNCRGNMAPCEYEHIFHIPKQNAEVKVRGINAHKCAGCGEVIYSSTEAKRIDEAIKNALSEAAEV